jgi:hypothetical protein
MKNKKTKMKISNYRVREYMRDGFNYRGKLRYGLTAFILYTFGFIKYHLKRVIREGKHNDRK